MVIAVPRDVVLNVVDDCAERGARTLVVITAGFAETGGSGRDLQQRLVKKTRDYGMRIVGPNCFGIINTDPTVCLNASFAPCFPRTEVLRFRRRAALSAWPFCRSRGSAQSAFHNL